MLGTCLGSDLNKPTGKICDNKGNLYSDWIFSDTKNYFNYFRYDNATILYKRVLTFLRIQTAVFTDEMM